MGYVLSEMNNVKGTFFDLNLAVAPNDLSDVVVSLFRGDELKNEFRMRDVTSVFVMHLKNQELYSVYSDGECEIVSDEIRSKENRLKRMYVDFLPDVKAYGERCTFLRDEDYVEEKSIKTKGSSLARRINDYKGVLPNYNEMIFIKKINFRSKQGRFSEVQQGYVFKYSFIEGTLQKEEGSFVHLSPK